MNKVIRIIILCIPVLFVSVFSAQKTEYSYFLKSISKTWEAETLYIGANVETVENGNEQVSIILKNGNPKVEGTLYLMKPGANNEELFICTNNIRNYGDTIKIGTFAPRTPLVFMYVITDINGQYAPLRGKKLYSGGNNPNDEYISAAEGMYGKKFAAVGQVDEKTVDVGFDASKTTAFLDIIFNVTGVKVKF